MHVTLLVMRVANLPDTDAERAGWHPGDIVDMWRGLEKDPGPGVPINPKHAVIVVRDISIPSTNQAFRRLRAFLTQINSDDDTRGDANERQRRRHQIVFADMTQQQRNAIRDRGRLVIQAADFPSKVRRKLHGSNLERRLAPGDLTNG